MFANGLVDQGSIPGWIIPKIFKKWYSMSLCLTLSIIRHGSKIKWSTPPPTHTMALKEVLVNHCSLAVSRRNGSPCHWIKTSQAERVGLPLCTSLLTIKLSRTGQFCNSSPITDLSTHTFKFLQWWARGKSNRCRWTLVIVVTNLHVGGPWASGHSFSWIQRQQVSSAAPVGDWAASLGQHCPPCMKEGVRKGTSDKCLPF